MSLEHALAENTAAIKELAALLKGGAIPAAAVEEPKRAAKKEKIEAAILPPEEVKAVETAPISTPEEPADPVVDYKMIAERITKLVAKDRAKTVEILASFGAKKGPDLKPEQYIEAFNSLEAALNG